MPLSIGIVASHMSALIMSLILLELLAKLHKYNK